MGNAIRRNGMRNPYSILVLSSLSISFILSPLFFWWRARNYQWIRRARRTIVVIFVSMAPTEILGDIEDDMQYSMPS
jgi:hypothetical protein